MRQELLKFVFLVLYFALTVSAPAYAKSFSDDAKGTPHHMGRKIPEKQYLPVVTKKLADAKILWVNWAYLKEHGYNGSKENLASEILENYAFAIPDSNEDSKYFLKEEKTFYSTFYGGGGIGFNLGDGRAAASGKFQIKGVGVTPMVKNEINHANGRASLEEAMREAYWGEVNARELPHGANRVIAIIDRGTTGKYPYGETHRDALIIREDPVRPAHFMQVMNDLKDPRAENLQFVPEETLLSLIEALPIPKPALGLNGTLSILAGLREFIKRTTAQHAASFAKGFYHGAPSESNIEIDGKFLDYGTHTSQPNHGKVHVLEHVLPAGETTQIKEKILNFLIFMTTRIRAARVDVAPLLRFIQMEFSTFFDKTYKFHLRHEFLKLIGVPTDIAESSATTRVGQTFADELIFIASNGAKPYLGRYDVPNQVTKYDFAKIARALTEPQKLDYDSIKASLEKHIPELKNPRRLIVYYLRFQMTVLAEHKELSASEYLKDQFEQQKKLNGKRVSGYRWRMMDENKLTISNYLKTFDPALIQRAVDERIQRSIDEIKVQSTNQLQPSISCRAATGGA